MTKGNIIFKLIIMKKVRLKNLNLSTNELLQREQLKTVFGGYVHDICPDGKPCLIQCPSRQICGGPYCPTQINVDEICSEPGGICNCYYV